MIVAIMQPYLLPYIGYMQLMAAVDIFVFYDDAKFIEHAWVNRNRILNRDQPTWLTVPVKRGSHLASIRDRCYSLDASHIKRIGGLLHSAYGAQVGSKHWSGMLLGALAGGSRSVAEVNIELLVGLADVLGIRAEFVRSSALARNFLDRGEERVISICRAIGATHYVNPIGGRQLYRKERFKREGIKLSFLRTGCQPRQFADHEEHLSILHDLIVDGVETCRVRLQSYELIEASDA